MSIVKGCSNQIFRYATNPEFDLSSSTAIFTFKFTSPLRVVTKITGRILAPNVQVNDPILGLLTAGTYLEMKTIESDFKESGNYTVCGLYEDSATTPPTKYTLNDVVFNVLDGWE